MSAPTTSEGLPYVAPFAAQFDPRQAQAFIIARLLRQMHTATLVQVLKVTPTAGKVGFVDVQPLVLEQDTRGTVIAQAPIYNVPYLRYQGGVSAVIMDPAIGDTGLAIFAERDIRNVKATGAESPAASDRTYNSADALYIGGVLNPDPTQFIRFKPGAGGIDVVTPGDLTATVGGALTATVTGAANVHASGALTLKSDVSITLDAPTITATHAITAPDVILPSANMNAHKHTSAAPGVNTSTPHN